MGKRTTQAPTDPFGFAARLSTRGPAIDEAAVAAFERAQGLPAPLPEDYRAFLVSHANGGRAETWLAFGASIAINAFFGVRDDDEWLSLGAAIQRGRRGEDLNPHVHGEAASAGPPARLPRECVPIASTPGGDEVLLALVAAPARAGAGAGSVWFRDHEAEPARGYDGSLATAKHLKRLSAGFAEFAAKLKPWKAPTPRGPMPALMVDDAAALAAKLDAGTDASKPDRKGKTLLHHAVDAGAVACVRLLLARGVRDQHAFTAAIMDEREAIVAEFLGAGVAVRPVDLADAAVRGNVEITRRLLERMQRGEDGVVRPIPGGKLALALGHAKMHAATRPECVRIISMLEGAMKP